MIRRLHLPVFAVSVGLFSFLTSCNPPQPTTQSGPLANATQVPNSTGMVEVTAGAVAPSSTQGGQIYAFGSGVAAAIGIPTGLPTGVPLPTQGPPNCTTADPNLPCYIHWGNDQETVQLPGGDFLVSWSGSSATNPSLVSGTPWYQNWGTPCGIGPAWNAPPPPPAPPCPAGFKYNFVFPVTQRDGIRAAQLLWRYSAQTRQFSWVGALDMAFVGGTDLNGNMQPAYCAPGVPWTGFGMDRPELYVDPWDSQHRTYLSGGCTLSTNPLNREIWTSLDYGVSWQGSGIQLPDGLVTAMTSTPNGVVYILQYTGFSPTVYFSTDHGASLVKDPQNPQQPLSLDVTYNTCGNGPGCQAGGKKLPAAYKYPPGAFSTNINPLAFAAVGPNSVLFVYSAWTNATLNNTQVNQQVAPVVMLGGAPGNTFIFPLNVITPTVAGGSVLMPSFITDNRNVANPVSMLYWIETDPIHNTAKARYMLFLGAGSFPTATQDLSASFPIPATTSASGPSIGDYMKGASYLTTDSSNNQIVNFVPVWPQTTVDSAGSVSINAWTRIIPVSAGAATAPFVPPSTAIARPPKIKAPAVPIERLPCDMCPASWKKTTLLR